MPSRSPYLDGLAVVGLVGLGGAVGGCSKWRQTLPPALSAPRSSLTVHRLTFVFMKQFEGASCGHKAPPAPWPPTYPGQNSS